MGAIDVGEGSEIAEAVDFGRYLDTAGSIAGLAASKGKF